MILTMYSEAIKLLHRDDIALVLDSKFNIFYASDLFINVLINKYKKDVINKKLHDIVCSDDSEVSILLKNSYELAFNSHKVQLVISAPGVLDKMDMFNLNYNHLYHPEHEILIGYALFITPVDLEQKMALLYQMLGLSSDSKPLKTVRFKLTEREQEILFLLCLNLSGREIAEVIAKKTNSVISPHTVGNVVRNRLFIKFEAYNIPTLIDKAVTLGYFKIPSKYCQYQILGIDKDKLNDKY